MLNPDDITARVWHRVMHEVRLLREDKYTLERIGSLLGVSKPTVQRWLEGNAGGDKTAFVDMLRYLNALGIDAKTLLFADDETEKLKEQKHYAEISTLQAEIEYLKDKLDALKDKQLNSAELHQHDAEQMQSLVAKQISTADDLIASQKLLAEQQNKEIVLHEELHKLSEKQLNLTGELAANHKTLADKLEKDVSQQEELYTLSEKNGALADALIASQKALVEQQAKELALQEQIISLERQLTSLERQLADVTEKARQAVNGLRVAKQAQEQAQKIAEEARAAAEQEAADARNRAFIEQEEARQREKAGKIAAYPDLPPIHLDYR